MSRTLASSHRTILASVILMVGWLLLLQACGGGGGGGGGGGSSTPKTWGTAVLIETDNAGNAESPQIAIDVNGNAFAVWHQHDGTRYNIWANRYTSSSNTWGTAVLIETDNAGNAYSPQIAIDANSNVLVVWYQLDGTRYNIWANRYTATSNTWGTAALIETNNAGSAYGPQIANDANGNALAVWAQSDGTRTNIWANRYTATSNTWGTAALIETNNAGDAVDPHIAMDANGNALALWPQFDGTRYNIWANRYTAASNTWGTAALIETNNAGPAFDSQIAIETNGNALAVWRHYDGTRYNIWANRYTAASNTWGTAILIETDNMGNAIGPQISIDASGNALAVWHQDGDATVVERNDIWANRYTAATNTWGTAVLIESDDAGSAEYPQIAIDTNGNALVVWHQDGDATAIERNDIWANRYTAATNTWGTAALIESDDAGSAFYPKSAIDANGNALAVWEQDGDTTLGRRYDIWANRYH